MDIGTISIVLVLGLIILLAIGMPLGLASAVLALVVLVLKFEPQLITAPFDPEVDWGFGPRPPADPEVAGSWITVGEGGGMLTSNPGTGALYILTQKIFDLMTSYVLISVPLFIFMAALLERSGIAKEMYNALDYWLSRVRGGVAIVTSIMAVIMAAMSGIIGGEVVLLGLIALPQMLRLGYNQNLAIGTICASGSLGTMIPPSIVLIIYGLITETSIKALFTGAFVPGFMLASMIIIYIMIRVRLRPEDAPLPEERPDPELERIGQNAFITQVFAGFGTLALGVYVWQLLRWYAPGLELAEIPGLPDRGILLTVILLAVVALVQLSRSAKGQAFLGFLSLIVIGGAALLLLRVLFFTVMGQNVGLEEQGEDPIWLGMRYHIPGIAIALGVGLGLAAFFGRDRVLLGWAHGKGLVPPLLVIFVVLGSIYGGITGITEAAGMGAFAVFVIALVRGEASVGLVWDSMMRTLRSTGTIIWVTIGAAALAGAYTLAGGPNYIANLIVGSEMPTMLVLLTMMLILLFMGAFMDWVGIVLLIIPVFLPIVKRLPIEEIGIFGLLEPSQVSIWFGVLFAMNMQVSFLSPPFGPAAFYLKSVAPPHISLTDIFRAFLPFIGVQLLALSVLLIWPPIVTLLL